MKLEEKKLYELNCGCLMRVMDNKTVQGKYMKGMFRGRFEKTCTEHRGHKTSWHLWKDNGHWYFLRHGGKSATRRKEFDVKRQASQENET